MVETVLYIVLVVSVSYSMWLAVLWAMQHFGSFCTSQGPVGKGSDGVTPLLQLFKGKFYHCLGVDIRNITNRSDCMAANYKWVHHKYNFDNLGQVSLPAVPPFDGNPTQGLSPPQGTDALPAKPMPGPEGAVIWHACPCRSCVTSGLVSEGHLQDVWERKVAAESLIFSCHEDDVLHKLSPLVGLAAHGSLSPRPCPPQRKEQVLMCAETQIVEYFCAVCVRA